MESQMNHIAQVCYHVYWQYLFTGHLLIKNRIDFIYIPQILCVQETGMWYKEQISLTRVCEHMYYVSV